MDAMGLLASAPVSPWFVVIQSDREGRVEGGWVLVYDDVYTVPKRLTGSQAGATISQL